MAFSSKVTSVTCTSIALLVSACATSSQTDPAKLTLDEDNEKSAVVVKLSGKNVNYFGVNSLSIIQYSEEAARNKPDRPPVKDSSRFIDLEYKLNTGGFTVAEVPPGTYFLARGNMPKKWAGCFNKNTVKFEVVPNKITYMGDINLDEFYTEMTAAMNAYEGDKLGKIDYDILLIDERFSGPKNFKNNLTFVPKFENSNPQNHQDVSDFLTKNGASVKVPVTDAKFEPISFPLGKDGCAQQ